MLRSALRLVVFLALACAALVGGAGAGGALRPARAEAGRPSRATDDLGYGRHSEVGEISVGDSLEVNGQPMQISIFYTSDAPGRVAQFYAEAFAARGVLPILSADPGYQHVAGFDPRDGLERFITALAQPDGQTLVLIGITNPRRPPRFTRGAEGAGFPVPRENRAFLGYRSSDAGAQAESGQYVSSLPAAEVLAFYRRELPARGWSERPADGSPALAVFARGGSTLSVAVQALEEKAGSAVFVNVTSGGAQ
jgi:hypothetical protein